MKQPKINEDEKLGLYSRIIIATSIIFFTVFGFLWLIADVIMFFVGFQWWPSFLVIDLAFVALIILMQYLVSPYLIKLFARIKWIQEDDHPYLFETVNRLAGEAGVSIKKIGISAIKSPNAFVYSHGGTHLVVTQGLLIEFQDDEEAFEGIICHELGHVKHHDMAFMTAMSALPLILWVMTRSLFYGAFFSSFDDDAMILVLLMLLFSILSMVLYVGIELGILLVSRYREYRADAFSKEMKGPEPLVRGLARLSYSSLHESKKELIETYQGKSALSLRAFFCVDPTQEKSDLTQYFKNYDGNLPNKMRIINEMEKELKHKREFWRTHPLTAKRIIALLKED
ncbi:MAG: M48 family metalloprotease [Candidatus Helarchaeota archaeon]